MCCKQKRGGGKVEEKIKEYKGKLAQHIVVLSLALMLTISGIPNISMGADTPETQGNNASGIISMNIAESVTILENGSARTSISINIPSSPLAETYRDMLGLSTSNLSFRAGEEIEIPTTAPLDTVFELGEEIRPDSKCIFNTPTQPVREILHESIRREELYTLGLNTTITNSKIVPFDVSGGVKIFLEGYSLLQLTYDSENCIFNISMGRFGYNKTGSATAFYWQQMGYIRQMLSSMGKSKYVSNRITNIYLPQNATLLNGNKIEGSCWKIDFGGGNNLCSSIEIIGDSILLSEEMIVTRQNGSSLLEIPKDLIMNYKCFNIEYSLTVPYERNNIHFLASRSLWDGYWKPLDWSFNLGLIEGRFIPIDEEIDIDEDGEGDIDVNLTIDVEFTISGYVGCEFQWIWLQWFEAWGKPQLSVEATANVSAQKSWDHWVPDEDGWKLFEWSTRYFVMIGPVPVEVEIELPVTAKIHLHVDAEFGLTVSAYAMGYVKLGVRYEDGWSPIAEYGKDAGYDWDMYGGATAWIKPVVTPQLQLNFYELGGPYLAFDFWANATASITIDPPDLEVTWGLYAGIDARVGISTGDLLDWLGLEPYDLATWNLWNITVAEGTWKPDIDLVAPTTDIEVGEGKYYIYNGKIYVSPASAIFLVATDDSSGVSTTWYKINGGDWQQYIDPIYLSGNDGDEYTLVFYSIDLAGNTEIWKQRNFTIDTTPPVSYLKIWGKNITENGVTHISLLSYLQLSSNEPSWRIWYKIFSDGSWSEWQMGNWNNDTYIFLEEGEYQIMWYAEDILGNQEDVHGPETFIVDLETDVDFIDIIAPTQAFPEDVPLNRIIQIEIEVIDKNGSFIPNLDKGPLYLVKIGDKRANVTWVKEDNEKYILHVRAPPQETDGYYDLNISLVKILWDEETNAVYYSMEISPIYRGLNWLRSHQNTDGSWNDDVGITALCTLAFLNYGYDEEDETVEKAIDYLLNNKHWFGSDKLAIYNDDYRVTYHTSIALLALKATHNPEYEDEIEKMKNWLIWTQWDEDCRYGSVSQSNWYYGGWGYGRSYSTRPDLSNTQWAMMALSAAGATNEDDENVWNKAIIHINRCQARDETNDMSWANGRTAGGFVYKAIGECACGIPDYGNYLNGYGSMTAAGIWSLLLAGVPVTDGRIENNEEPYGGIDWFENHYSWIGNPIYNNLEYPHCYYYFVCSMAKALTMAGKTHLVINGDTHDWYEEMSAHLIDLQHSEGYWQGTTTGWENIRELATAFALLALETRELPPGAELWVSIILASHADLHVYDMIHREGIQVKYMTSMASGQAR